MSKKKTLKRSLALGALMAFVITGSAMAAEVTDPIIDEVFDEQGSTGEIVNIVGATSYGLKGYGEITGYDSIYVSSIGNNALTTTEGKKTTISAGTIKLVANNNNGNAIQGDGDLNLTATGDMYLSAMNRVIRGHQGAELALNAKNIYMNVDETDKLIDDATIKITDGADLEIFATENFVLNAIFADELKDDVGGKLSAIWAVGAGVSVNAACVDITTVTNHAEKYSYGVLATDGSEVDIVGKTIDIDVTSTLAEGNSVNFARGVNAVKSVVNLGDDTTETINITVDGYNWEDNNYGILAQYTDGKVNVVTTEDGELNVTVFGGGSGIGAMNNTTPPDDNLDDNAKVVIDGDTVTTINVYDNATDMNPAGNAISVMSMGRVDVKGDLYATAKNVVLTRGDSIVNINADEDGASLGKEVVLNGDVAFDFHEASSGTAVNSTVNINLDNEGSEWTGNTKVSWEIKADGSAFEKQSDLDDKLEVKDFTLGISNGAAWNPTIVKEFGNVDVCDTAGVKHTALNNLVINDGIINMPVMPENSEDPVIAIEKVTGSGGVINVQGITFETADDGDKLAIAQVAIGEKAEGTVLTVNGSGAIADQIAAGEVTVQDLADTVVNVEQTDDTEITETSVADVITTEEGLVAGAITAEVDEEGMVVADSVKQAVNQKAAKVSKAAANLKAHYRAHMNDMNKRMGELRMANGEAGVWTRMVRGETEYEGAKMQYNQYQLGYDEKLSVDKRWIVGAAVTFAEGDGSYGQGTTDDKSTAFAIYGSKLNNDGTFVDLIARYAHLESDMDDSRYGAGDYSTNGMSVSAEFGKRIQQGNGLWIEPQVELTYGSVEDANVKLSNGVNANFGSMDSFIARAGFALGKDIKQGNVYARASYLYDFDGESTTVIGSGTTPIEEDFGGGWWEVGVGANINLSKATYIYADVEKTFGGEVDTNWQWNLGVRYSF